MKNFVTVDPDALTPEERVEYFAACKALESFLKKQLETLRPFCLEDAKKKEDTWAVEGHKVSRSVKESKIPDEEKLLALLKEKNLDPLIVFEQIVMYQVNPSKLDHLIAIGVFTKAELEPLYKRSEVLEITPSKELKEKIVSNLTKLLTE